MIKVCELFAGVGGFRLGLERASDEFKFVWANQWEPGKIKQHAFDCYISHFGEENHENSDISKIDKNEIKDHDLLVGGFPCQDYSVTSIGAKGIKGKEGVLWWEIRDILEAKKPRFVLLENVDRLLKSPASQRGRDFGVMLACFNDLGYSVEWRVINAAEYGFSQRRRRIFIFAFKNDTEYAKSINKNNLREWIYNKGFFQNEFPIIAPNNILEENVSYGYVKQEQLSIFNIENIELEEIIMEYKDIVDISNNFKMEFKNTGIMTNGVIYTEKTVPKYDGEYTLLKDILETNVDEKYYLDGDEEKLAKWEYLKGAKKIPRTSKSGCSYVFSEGAVAFPDPIDRPARTMLTSESSVNRSTHVVRDLETNRLRLLTPVETERLNGFDDNWTNSDMPEKFRYFCMGNALVVGLVEKMGRTIEKVYKYEDLYRSNYEISKMTNQMKCIPKLSKFFEENKIDEDLLTDTLNKRLVNIEFIKNLDRTALQYEKNERQLFINKFGNEEIVIQYPGKESNLNRRNEGKIRPWDFRPKAVYSNIKDLEFEDIWNALYRVSLKDTRALKLVAAEFCRIAFMLDYKLCEEYTTYIIDINRSNEKYRYETKLPIYIYQPNMSIVKELENIQETILGMSWEMFFAYNDLIGFNEDCKYYYGQLQKEKEKQTSQSRKTPEERTETYIKKGVGRINTFLTHMGIIINLDKEELCIESLICFIYELIQKNGIVETSINDIENYLEEFICKE